jgi:CRISPR/Cas system-associated endonuclease Cas3-HD
MNTNQYIKSRFEKILSETISEKTESILNKLNYDEVLRYAGLMHDIGKLFTASFKDSKEVYTNGTILVPLYRVLDAISQKGEPYQSS